MESASRGTSPVAHTRRAYRPVIDALKRTFGHRLKTVVLFGSQARGAPRPGSDHDLFVVIDGLPLDRLKRQWLVRQTLLLILNHLPGPISFAIKTPEELDANLTPLLLDVSIEGICLHGRKFFEPYRNNAIEALSQSGLTRKQVGGTLMWVFPHIPTRDWELNWEGYREIPR